MEMMRVLILEETHIDIDPIEWALKKAGISVASLRVETGRGYVNALQEFSPDIILSDYNLPQYAGTLALAAAKKICPDVPFISW